MLKNTIFFVHIPKTGGTSFRKALEREVGKINSYYDYGKESEVTNPLILQASYQDQNINGLLALPELNTQSKNMLCGHTRITKYAQLVSPSNIITFIRDPIERVISHYEHLKRQGSFDADLLDFCRTEKYRNLQSKFLKGYPLELIGFIGITELFEQSIDVFEQQYNLPIRELKLNQNTKKPINKKYKIDKEILSTIASMNEEDITLYNDAKTIFNDKYKFINESAYKIYGHIDEVNQNFVKGWCYINNEPKKSIIIDVFINNKLSASVIADKCRPKMRRLNTPNKGFIGFKLEHKIDEGDIVQCRVKGSLYNLPGKSVF
jgi:hypothetical protein